MSKKVYLGDSVYADFDGYHVVLTTENGMGPSNRIMIEPQVYEALCNYVTALRAGVADEPQGPTLGHSIAAMDQYMASKSP